MEKKVYASPVAEKITFSYKEQVTASTPNGGATCTQTWEGYSSLGGECKITETIKDSDIA